ncbi:MAG: SDR family NAD(P)-dependent oxidoreductase [Syntrophaceae bacterium]|nr:SDR family NAD(P)-dependent oxidoreductase [Syntrophaceae bacterium]
MQLTGKRVVITGAGSGLGRAFAVALAKRNCRIGVTDINLQKAEETLNLVEKNGGRGEVMRVDVTDAGAVKTMSEHFWESWGGVDLLINNAGVISVGHVADIPLENWQWQYEVNFWGVVYGCHYFIPMMKKQKSGHILNVASSFGFLSFFEIAPYNSTKAAVLSLSETLKTELAPAGIGVTALCPMFFATNLLESLRYTDEFQKEFAHVGFKSTRMGADGVAEAGLRAVEKNKLYCVPHFFGRLYWRLKRLQPELFYAVIAWLNCRKWGKDFMLWMDRKGLLH